MPTVGMELRASDNGVMCWIPRTQKSSLQLTKDTTAPIKQEVEEDHFSQNYECFSEGRKDCCEDFNVLLTKRECNDTQECCTGLNCRQQPTFNENEEIRGVSTKLLTSVMKPVKNEWDRNGIELWPVFANPRSITLQPEVKQEEECRAEVQDYMLFKFEPELDMQEACDDGNDSSKYAELGKRNGSDVDTAGKSHTGTFVDTCSVKAEYKSSNTHGSQVQVFVCSGCNYVVTEKNSLRKHIKRFHNDTMQKCSKSKHQKNISTNTRMLHPHFAKQYKCTECDFTTKLRHYLPIHVTRKHSLNAPVYQCIKCSYTAKWKGDLSVHIKAIHSMHAAFYKCPHCNFTTKHKKNIPQHLTVKHNPNAKLYQCTECNYISKCKQYLTRHVTIKHNPGVTIFRCAKCSYTTKLKGYLHLHMKVHNYESAELHKCPHCDYTSKRRYNLTRHLKLQHSANSELFKCTHCDFTTKRKCHLNNHITAKHSRDAPLHRCAECSYTSKVKEQLSRHTKIQHNEHAEL